MVEPGVRSNVVGHRWLLIETESGDVRVEHPPSLREAWLDLRADGELSWFDSARYRSGRYTRSRDGITVLGPMSMPFGDVDGASDSRHAAARAAFMALFECTNSVADEHPISLSVRDAVLEVRAGTHTLRFRRAGQIGQQP